MATVKQIIEYTSFASDIDLRAALSPNLNTIMRVEVVSAGGGTVVLDKQGLETVLTDVSVGDVDIIPDKIMASTNVAKIRVYFGKSERAH